MVKSPDRRRLLGSEKGARSTCNNKLMLALRASRSLEVQEQKKGERKSCCKLVSEAQRALSPPQKKSLLQREKNLMCSSPTKLV